MASSAWPLTRSIIANAFLINHHQQPPQSPHHGLSPLNAISCSSWRTSDDPQGGTGSLQSWTWPGRAPSLVSHQGRGRSARRWMPGEIKEETFLETNVHNCIHRRSTEGRSPNLNLQQDHKSLNGLETESNSTVVTWFDLAFTPLERELLD